MSRLAKFFRKFIPETRWSITERAVSFQRGWWRWASKGDNILGGTSAAIGLNIDLTSYRYEGWVVVRILCVRESIL